MNMKLSRLAIIGATVLTASLAIAEDRHAATVHYTHTEGAFFPGAGFASQPESYAAQENGTGMTTTVTADRPDTASKGHEYSISEYLFFSGKGFSSTEK